MRLLTRIVIEGGDLDRYFRQVATLCPFLEPAMRNGTLIVYAWDGSAAQRALPGVSAEEWLFALAVILSERSLRREGSKTAGVLFSENILCTGLPAAEPHAFVYPHWAIKCMYRQSGLVYGKFMAGRAATQDGDVSNVADLFTIRKLTKPSKEARFYEPSELLHEHFQNQAAVPEYEGLLQAVAAAVSADLIRHEISDSTLVQSVRLLECARVYHRALTAAKELYGQ